MLINILSSRRRTAAIKRAQDRYMERLISDDAFAAQQALHPRHASLARWIDKSCGTRLLELGCGPGRYVALLANLGFDVTGVDLLAFDSWPRLSRRPNVHLLSGVGAEDLPFEDGVFDHIVCLGALLYFSDPAKAMREMHRVLRPGGRLVLRTVNKNNRYTLRTGNKLDPTSKNLFSREELEELVENSSFSVEEIFQYGYYPRFLPNLYWYLVNVHFSPEWEEKMSNALPADHRVNNVVFATRR